MESWDGSELKPSRAQRVALRKMQKKPRREGKQSRKAEVRDSRVARVKLGRGDLRPCRALKGLVVWRLLGAGGGLEAGSWKIGRGAGRTAPIKDERAQFSLHDSFFLP